MIHFRPLSMVLGGKKITHFITAYPSRMIVFFFAMPIFFGSLLLSLPIATAEGFTTSYVDALFTATSAICVTGLIVVDTATHFSTFGQGIILGLIQIGGLGIMIMSSFIMFLGSESMRLKQRYNVQNFLDMESYEEVLSTIKYIFWGTISIEAVGAIILSVRFYFDSHSLYTALWWGVFHSISAFCNAGFSLFSDSLIRYQADPVVNLVIPILIITGGLGFATIGPLLHLKMPKGIHVRLTITVTFILIVAGLFFLLSNEFSNSLIGYSLVDKFRITFFQSVTTRTAGFNTIDIAAFSPATLLFMMILMFIGGSPGSTAGGIKTTTLGVLVLAARSFFKSSEDVEYSNRRIPLSTLLKSVAIFLSSSTILTLFAMILFITEKGPWQTILFEVFSAFGTVGLSLGLTPTLSTAGRILITMLMFIGRVGPLTVVAMVGENPQKPFYHHPTGRVMVG